MNAKYIFEPLYTPAADELRELLSAEPLEQSRIRLNDFLLNHSENTAKNEDYTSDLISQRAEEVEITAKSAIETMNAMCTMVYLMCVERLKNT